MRKSAWLIAMGFLLYFSPQALAEGASANTLKEVYSQIRGCLKLPATPEGGDMTIQLTLKRNGALLGKPKITFSKNAIAQSHQADFMGAVLQALQGCFPVKVTDSLGGAIAGRPMRFRIQQRAHEIAI